MFRVKIDKIINGKVTLLFPGETEPRNLLYSYPKGVSPELPDKVYVSNLGKEYIIILVQGG